MNILFFSELLREAGKSKSFSACVRAGLEGRLPLDVEGCEGALGAMLAAALYEARPGLYFIVVPQETDAQDFALDLEASGVPFLIFPWWGAVPYRELPPLSAVFGERIKVLSDLVLGKPCVVIIPERAFLTPLPPPEYVKSLLATLEPAGAIDTAGMGKLLVSYGYTRVPRVQMRGQFALRGEVLDIFMGGEESACRVLFDFDKVESIRRFDPLNQAAYKEKLDALYISPMKEVVWTDDRIETLEKNLANCKEFQDGGKAVIEELISNRAVSGEEMFYPLFFEKAGSLLDYLGAQGTLVLVGRER
ncbi:MAG: transcription-repair coupling factor, partial [Treponema sp.]|nr:transcription-repair coupling factor [Treponema sp.]